MCFHGRSAATWEARGTTSAERFDWYYRDEELAKWVPKVRELSERAEEVHVLMNTNRFDQGPANARRIARLMAARGLKVRVGTVSPVQRKLELE